MKILKVGRLATKQVSCPQCESELEYSQEDITKQKYCYQGGKCGKHEGYKEIITCPVCKQTIEVGKYETGYTSPYVLQTMYKIEADKQAKKEKIIEEAKALGLHLA